MALRTLGASSQETAQMVDLLTTPRSLRLAKRVCEETLSNETPVFDYMPGICDLLRAMRLRRRWTQSELAEQVGVSRHAVLRWETGRNTIDSDYLERLCVLLKAAPEERTALQTRRLILPQSEDAEWKEKTVAEMRFYWEKFQEAHNPTRAAYRETTPLFDLYALAMKRHLQIHITPGEQALSLLAQIETDHAIWLCTQDREPEADAPAQRALRLMAGEAEPQHYWADALNIATACASGKQSDWIVSAKLLTRWIPRLPAGTARTMQLCDLAVYLAMADKIEESFTALAEAERSRRRSQEVSERESYYLRISQARVQLAVGQNAELEGYLWDKAINTYKRQHLATVWARALLKRGDLTAARSYLEMALSQTAGDIVPQMNRIITQLSQRLY